MANVLIKIKNNSLEYKKGKLQKTISAIKKDKLLYIMAIPGICFFLLFRYVPMYGITIAFKDYNIYKGFSESAWVGFVNFQKLFGMYGFQRSLYNTLVISLAKIIFGFPVPIIFAILLNEVNNTFFKKFVQTSVSLPNFISWVVVQGFLYALFSPSSGAIKEIMNSIGYQGDVINLLANKEYFRQLIVISDIWKGFGYGSIIYIATISTIDQELYEASKVDGASKLRQIWHITLPGLRSTIIIMLILRVGSVLDAGFEQIYAIYNPMVYDVSEILDTFIYKLGIEKMNFSVSTAAGVFKSVIGLIMVIITNYIAGKIDEGSALIQRGEA